MRGSNSVKVGLHQIERRRDRRPVKGVSRLRGQFILKGRGRPLQMERVGLIKQGAKVLEERCFQYVNFEARLRSILSVVEFD